MGTEARENKVKFAFQVFDLDGSGSIDSSELRKIVKATNMASEKQLNRKVEWLMKQCDTDGDGQISFDEFVNLSKKFPTCLPGVLAGERFGWTHRWEVTKGFVDILAGRCTRRPRTSSCGV